MNFIAKSLIFILSVILLASCYTTHYIPAEADWNTYWKGKAKTQIIQAYGIANRIESDGANGYIMIYEEFITNTNQALYGNVNTTNYQYINSTNTNIIGRQNTSSSQERIYKEFFMNENDKCYLVRTNYTKAEKVYDAKKTTYSVGGSLLIILACFFPLFLAL